MLNTSKPAQTQHCDLFAELCTSLTSDSAAQTESALAAAVAAAPPRLPQQRPRPRPRPRSRLSAPVSCSEVKVQTLVKLREDGLATLAARAKASQADQQGSREVSQGRYLQELLEAFSADDWGFPERRSDGSECSQSESEVDEEQEDGQDMATLKARIQVFEQQPASDRSCGSSSNEEVDNTKRPEPRPRPRLQPAKSPPPTIAPKPKNFSHAPKPSTKFFWEAADSTPVTSDLCSSDSLETTATLQATSETTTSLTATSCTHLTLQSDRETEKPSPSLKTSPEALLSDTSVPVPAPRPPPPRADPQPRPPPRPAAAPRVSGGPTNQERDAMPARSDRTQDTVNVAGKCLLLLTAGVCVFRGIY